MTTDAQRGAPATSGPRHRDPFAEERTFLDALAKALEALGGLNTTIRQPYGMGVPYLHAEGGGTMGEDIRLRRVSRDGSLRAVWPWGEDLPTDPAAAAEAIRRVVKPEM
ncbi:hypothetical protein [Actinomadura atramentaria]|uniref:hypothetical protein n=1 Tax=Actinomadura atramentaria TaxID=1990 RepID=UPI00036786B3|nr:hypothetical protein [Actinomadura atramentaria]